MEQTRCSMLHSLRDPAERCPSCGNTPEVLAAELARLNKSIADAGRRGSHPQRGAQHPQQEAPSRDASAAARQARRQERLRAAARTQAAHFPATHRPTDYPDRAPAGRYSPEDGTGRPRVAPLHQPAPETSARSAQNLRSAVFSSASRRWSLRGRGDQHIRRDHSRDDPVAGHLAASIGAPALIKARLTSTAKLDAVGLVMLPITGYVVGTLPGVTASLYIVAGIVFAITSVVSFVYLASASTSARYAVVIAAQPVVPLLAFDVIRGPAGWALVFALLAAANAIVARGVELSHRILAVGAAA